MARLKFEGKKIEGATFQFVRHNDANESVLCALAQEQAALEDIRRRSASFGTKLAPQGDQVAFSAG